MSSVLATLGFSDVVALLALVVSLAGAVGAYQVGRRQTVTARQSNELAGLVELIGEHRSDHLARARRYVYGEGLAGCDPAAGLAGLPEEMRAPVRDLIWFYDNVGVLVAHGVIRLQPIAGCVGGAVLVAWPKLAPLIEAERRQRDRFPDSGRWVEYFENLYVLINEYGPERARRELELWKIY